GKNPRTPKEVLMKLMREHWMVRRAVASNPNVPEELIEKLANDEDWEVRWAIAKNPKTPMRLLTKLANDENEYVRKEAMARCAQAV
ncbi:MAG: HEAT repeat domain-containing protein, partial [Candidatus Korarchaeum sp.]